MVWERDMLRTGTKPPWKAGVVTPVRPRAANKIPAMQSKRALFFFLPVATLGVWLAGCSTVDLRIARNREVFSTWPPAVQEKVAAGQIDLGFTSDQVRVALGEPDRVFTRTTADGTSEVWSYRDRRPRFGFGVGVGGGGFHGRHGTFGGVGIGTGGGYYDDEKLGVVFDRTGRVTAIEQRHK